MDGPCRRLAAAEVRAVDEVVVHEGRQVHELDRDAGDERRLAIWRSGKKDEQRPQALAAGGERLVSDRGDDARMARDRPRQPLLDRVEVLLGVQRASPMWSATMPPANTR